MARQTLRICTSRLLLGPLLVTVCVALLASLVLSNAERFDILAHLQVPSWAKSETHITCSCDANVLGPQPNPFLLKLDDDPANSSLLYQAGRYQGNIFLRMKQKGDEKPLPYGISMFHQLHCVEMLRNALQGNIHGHHPSHSRPRERGIDHEEHIAHCLEYIAQVRPILTPEADSC